MSASPHSTRPSAELGQRGERLVAQWLHQQGWHLVAQGWHSRWGELDVVAHAAQPHPGCLAFVEVKTRSSRNWDGEGLYAITQAKQIKLWKTAQCFLAQHPQWAEVPCRFDVALVSGRRWDPSAGRRSPFPSSGSPSPLVMGQPVFLDGYALTLHTYLEAAFEVNF